MSSPSVRGVAWLAWLLSAAMWLAAWAPAVHAEVRVIATAERMPLDGALSDGPVTGQTVALPDVWNKQALEGTWLYHSSFHVPAERVHEALGLYIPRAGNRFEVQLNGRAVGQFGYFADDPSDYAQRPHYLALPRDWIVPGLNRLSLTVQGERGRFAGVSMMYVGPAHEVRPLFLQREMLQIWGSFVTVFTALVLGAVSAALARMTRDRTIVLFALACAFCALRTCYALVVTPPFDYRLWGWLLDTCYAAYLVCLCGFATQVAGHHSPAFRMATLILVAATAVLVPLHAFGRIVAARQVWTMLMVIYAMGLCLLVIYAWYRRRTPVNATLAMAGAISVCLAVYDHILVFYSSTGYGAVGLARFSLLIFMLAMAWILVLRYMEKVRQESGLRAELADDLARKTAELAAQFEARQQLILQTAHQHERQRLMQDLHDSMGFQLSGLLAMVEHGDIQRHALTAEVRTTIEQMRMLVDSADDFDGDLAQLLGHVRYRIQTRLQRCGIDLDWQMHLDERLPPLDPAHALTLQRLIFELCTNVIRHARARRVTVRIAHGAAPRRALMLSLEDDGIGYCPIACRPGVGSASLRRRIEELGGALALDSSVQRGTAYAIELPLKP
jgi:signal transduction histidine kinase